MITEGLFTSNTDEWATPVIFCSVPFLSRENRAFVLILLDLSFYFACENLFNFNYEKYLSSWEKYDENFDAAAICYGLMERIL